MTPVVGAWGMGAQIAVSLRFPIPLAAQVLEIVGGDTQAAGEWIKAHASMYSRSVPTGPFVGQWSGLEGGASAGWRYAVVVDLTQGDWADNAVSGTIAWTLQDVPKDVASEFTSRLGETATEYVFGR